MSEVASKVSKLSNIVLQRILVVEDDSRLSEVLASALSAHADEVRICNTNYDAAKTISDWRPELIVLDFKLSDGDGIKLLTEVSQYAPSFPNIIAISAYARPDEAFNLAQYGVRVFLQKPIDLVELETALKQVLVERPNLDPFIRCSVGHVGIKNLEKSVRQTMMEEALSRANGSRRGAAKILRVSRQFVQHVIKNFSQ